VSRVSEKRLASDLAQVVRKEGQTRRRRDVAVIVFTFFGGLIGNFVFNKIEWAAFLWTVSLIALSDLVVSFWKLSALRGFWRFLVVLLIAALLWWPSYPFVWNQYRVQHAALTSGVLRARSDSRDHSQEIPKFQIGSNGIVLGFKSSVNTQVKTPADKIRIIRNGNQLKFSTTVRDKEGNLIVEIVDNAWRVSPSTANCWDKNYTDDALEVKDGRGRVVLQVKLLPDRVQLQVEWPNMGDSSMVGANYSQEDGIKPMFKYPSNEHWGELDNIKKLPQSVGETLGLSSFQEDRKNSN